jgi:hypothetical protein
MRIWIRIRIQIHADSDTDPDPKPCSIPIHFFWLGTHFPWLNTLFPGLNTSFLLTRYSFHTWLNTHFPWLNTHFPRLNTHFPWLNTRFPRVEWSQVRGWERRLFDHPGEGAGWPAGWGLCWTAARASQEGTLGLRQVNSFLLNHAVSETSVGVFIRFVSRVIFWFANWAEIKKKIRRHVYTGDTSLNKAKFGSELYKLRSNSD